jgi:hypothetical protein
MSAAPRDLTAVSGVEDTGWRAQRTRAPALDRHAMVRGQIGVLEVFAAVEAGRVGEVMLAGDPIAPAETIAALERALRGCPRERGAIDAAVRAVLADPARFVLGLGPATTITDAVARAVGV